MKRACTYPTGIALAAAVALGSLPAAHAQPAPAERVSAAAVSQALSTDAASGNASVTSVEGLGEKLIAKYDPYVTVDKQGAYTLNPPADQDFPASEVELVKKAISQANADQKQAVASGAAGVVAGAFAAAGGIGGLCNWNGKGITVRKSHVGPVVCWPR